ncbi:hypothetical protein [Streptomyces sp. DH12]|uniref:hypothetical protein n=1 Tax=Streptomyces sp. DH12 TaxID=2857010 RepID=UPI001E41E7BF|nr:hypothetical protein [Streptomyces sp. DH12]
MPDRGRRTAINFLPRDRQSNDDDNPFAPPPEGRPEQPWQPRRPDGDGGGEGHDGRGDDGREGRPAWGRWSPRQPGRSSDGFGGSGGGGGAPQDPSRQKRQDGPQLRWDPTDPSQRRARYALLSGMWGFFFAVFDFPELALLLGALALYWGISSLRERGRTGGRTGADVDAVTSGAPTATGSPGTPSPAPRANAAGAVRSQTTAAVSGLITGALALVIVAAMFTVQLVYREYYTCVDDALTKDGQLSCNRHLPEPLRDLIGVKQ